MTANDSKFNDSFVSIVAISGDTLLVEVSGKDVGKGSAYAFVLAGDGLWDKVTKLIARNGIDSR